ncbi:MAG: hypothetical protein HDS83_04760 [Bacteroidales bacterium]|nr:hypothetical protein [Bacteroidales bacterium]
MKKLLFIFIGILFSIISFSSNAQINSKILNVTLGQSTQQNVLNMVQKNGYKFTQTSTSITCTDVEFAGYGWEKTIFYFYKNVFYKVEFKDPYVISEKEIKSWERPTSESEIYKRIRQAIKTKYSKYDKTWDIYSDGTTKFEIGWSNIYYENISLAKKVSEESLNDL